MLRTYGALAALLFASLLLLAAVLPTRAAPANTVVAHS